MKRAYVDVPGGQVHYRTEGRGRPLILIHQSVCSSDEYSRVLPLLAKNYRVIAMDTLGYGESDKPPRVYDIPDYEEIDVKRLSLSEEIDLIKQLAYLS